MKPPDTEHDDTDLVRRVVLRDAEAFTILYDRHSTLLYSVALKILADPEEARDVLQQVFLTLHEKAAVYNPALGRPVAWLSVMARNKAIDRCRSLKRQREYAERIRQETPSPEYPSENSSETHNRDELDYLHAAVAQLPDEQRQALTLAYFSGLTQQEISDTLSQPLGTVKARIRRGLIKLRESLGQLLD
ncbi:MAG: sigma-70 family RNA polymerase sigma factor [Verrucomicrobiaceae bacterium]|nr:MAG: sigma-70 family RNA polymerase sigma factor [Verrucomicrobiaceae bacterium]